MTGLDANSTAVLSACGTYRHALIRQWSAGPLCGWIMLNPSTADAEADDPTIRRCIGFAKREGCGGLIVVNLYQLRATDPRELRRHPDPIGPDADDYLLLAAAQVDGPLIAGWGTKGGERAGNVAAMLGDYPLMCLGRSKDGHPIHPLYRPGDAPLIPMHGDKGRESEA